MRSKATAAATAVGRSVDCPATCATAVSAQDDCCANHGSASAQDGAVADTRSLLTVIFMSSQTHPHSVQATSEWTHGAEGRVESFKVLTRSGPRDIGGPIPSPGLLSVLAEYLENARGILGGLGWPSGAVLVD